MRKYATASTVLEARPARGGLLKDAHRAEFHYDPKPGMLYVRSRAISSRVNDNFDGFSAPEIKSAYRSFIGKPVFVNHANENHRRARGVIVDAVLHEDRNPDGSPDTWVEVLHEVDAVSFPRLAKGILDGDIDRTSMGTDVAYSLCSVCGNKAVTPLDYCNHIRYSKGQKLRRRNAATGSQEDVLIYEDCYGLGFFENSLLVEEPADPTAWTLGDIVLGENTGLVQRSATRIARDLQPDMQATWRYKDGDRGYGTGIVESSDSTGWTTEDDQHITWAEVYTVHQNPGYVPRDQRHAMGPRDTPVSTFGMTYAPNPPPEVALAKDYDWDTVPIKPISLDQKIYATEATLASSSIDKVINGSEPLRPGYDPCVLYLKGRCYVIDGHHRVAMHKGLGNPTMNAHVLDGSKISRQVSKAEVATILDKLAGVVNEATKKDKGPETYNLCDVQVAGTNLFCKSNKGIPRGQMPQLSNDGKDLAPQFAQYLKDQGNTVTNSTVSASSLKASQMELNAKKVAGMVQSLKKGSTGEGFNKRIFVSSDNYIVDGHHRWAAKVGYDLEDGDVGDVSIPIAKVNMGIIPLLKEANNFAKDNGIAQRGIHSSKTAVLGTSYDVSQLLMYPDGHTEQNHFIWDAALADKMFNKLRYSAQTTFSMHADGWTAVITGTPTEELHVVKREQRTASRKTAMWRHAWPDGTKLDIWDLITIALDHHLMPKAKIDDLLAAKPRFAFGKLWEVTLGVVNQMEQRGDVIKLPWTEPEPLPPLTYFQDTMDWFKDNGRYQGPGRDSYGSKTAALKPEDMEILMDAVKADVPVEVTYSFNKSYSSRKGKVVGGSQGRLFLSDWPDKAITWDSILMVRYYPDRTASSTLDIVGQSVVARPKATGTAWEGNADAYLTVRGTVADHQGDQILIDTGTVKNWYPISTIVELNGHLGPAATTTGYDKLQPSRAALITAKLAADEGEMEWITVVGIEIGMSIKLNRNSGYLMTPMTRSQAERGGEWHKIETISTDPARPRTVTLHLGGDDRILLSTNSKALIQRTAVLSRSAAMSGNLWRTSTGVVHKSLQCGQITSDSQLQVIPTLDVAESSVVQEYGHKACTFCYRSAPTTKQAIDQAKIHTDTYLGMTYSVTPRALWTTWNWTIKGDNGWARPDTGGQVSSLIEGIQQARQWIYSHSPSAMPVAAGLARTAGRLTDAPPRGWVLARVADNYQDSQRLNLIRQISGCRSRLNELRAKMTPLRDQMFANTNRNGSIDEYRVLHSQWLTLSNEATNLDEQLIELQAALRAHDDQVAAEEARQKALPVKVPGGCDRCGGTGETTGGHWLSKGVCFACGGTGQKAASLERFRVTT